MNLQYIRISMKLLLILLIIPSCVASRRCMRLGEETFLASGYCLSPPNRMLLSYPLQPMLKISPSLTPSKNSSEVHPYIRRYSVFPINSLKISSIDYRDYIDNRELFNELYSVAAPSYEDPTAVIKRDLNHCNKVYLGRDIKGNLISFFMVGWEPLLFRGYYNPSVYLGLGVTHQDKKNTGIIRSLFSHFILDARKWEEEENKKLLLWYTTPTPSIFNAINAMFSNNQPRVDGSYDEEGKELALAIRKRMSWHLHSGGHPFVVKGIAENTRYSALERERIEKIIKAKEFNLFKELGIDETQGDRMVGICRIPSISNL